MKHTTFLPVAWVCAAMLAVLPIAAQQVSEQAVNREKAFIEASRERLLGNYDKAVPLLEKILKEDAQNDAALFELARIRQVRGQPAEAMELLEKATALVPQNTWYAQMLAEVYQQLGRGKQAAAVYERLAKAQPRNTDYHYKWALLLVQQRDVAGAIKVYDQLEKTIGVNEELARRKHTLYMGEGNVKKATRELERLVETFPNNTSHRLMLAGFHEQTGNAKAAETTYREVLRIDPTNSRAQLALAGTGKAKGETAALEALRPVFEQPDLGIDPKIARLYPYITHVADTGDRTLADAALGLTDILQRVHPLEAKGFAAAGDLLYHSGRPQEALAKYRRTIDLDASVFSVWEQMMRTYAELGDFRQLADIAEEAADLYPNRAAVYLYEGMARRQLGQPDRAVDALRQGLRMSAGNEALQAALNAELEKAIEAQRRQ